MYFFFFRIRMRISSVRYPFKIYHSRDFLRSIQANNIYSTITPFSVSSAYHIFIQNTKKQKSILLNISIFFFPKLIDSQSIISTPPRSTKLCTYFYINLINKTRVSQAHIAFQAINSKIYSKRLKNRTFSPQNDRSPFLKWKKKKRLALLKILAWNQNFPSSLFLYKKQIQKEKLQELNHL